MRPRHKPGCTAFFHTPASGCPCFGLQTRPGWRPVVACRQSVGGFGFRLSPFPDGFRLRFEAVRSKIFYILCKGNFLAVQLVTDNVCEVFRQFFRCFDKHVCDRLSVLDVCSISACTSHNNDLQYFIHVCFEFFVYVSHICLREITQMYAFRCSLVNAAYQVAVDVFCHKRNHRCSCF